MNILEIFGIIFCVELGIVTTIIVGGFIISYMSIREKKRTYNEMIKYEAQLKKKGKVPETKKDIDVGSSENPVIPEKQFANEIANSDLSKTNPELNEKLKNCIQSES